MSDTDTPRTHCIMCNHPAESHAYDDNGNRPCRSVNHPAGINCVECARLITTEAVESARNRRSATDDPAAPEARAWSAYNLVRQKGIATFGEAWQAFFTDIHQTALMAALTEYDLAKTGEQE